MADLESLVGMTARQAQDMRGLGGYAGAMFVTLDSIFLFRPRTNACPFRFMSASKVLGEETVKGSTEPSKDGEQGP